MRDDVQFLKEGPPTRDLEGSKDILGGDDGSSNSVDDGLRTSDGITSSPDLRKRGTAVGISLDAVPVRGLGVNTRELRLLADGLDNLVTLDDKLRARDGLRSRTTTLVSSAELHADALETSDSTVLDDNLDGLSKELQLDTLLFGFSNLVLGGGHLVALTTVDDGGLRAKTTSSTDGIHSAETSTNDDDLLADLLAVLSVDGLKEADDVLNTLGVLTGDLKLLGLHAADGENDSVVLLLEVLELDVLTEGGVKLELNTHGKDAIDISLEHVTRKTV